MEWEPVPGRAAAWGVWRANYMLMWLEGSLQSL